MTPPDSNQTDPSQHEAKTGSNRSKGKEPGPRPAPRRLWLMRLTAVMVVPALLLGSLELVLRLADYGYSTRFFEKGEADGQEFLYVNHQFAYRFFTSTLARSAIPQRLTAKKASDTYRIFVFGESAANGDPDPAYSFGRNLEILLRERYPGTRFEVICTAITAINSHAILPLARECAQLDGDLWIIYMGNNEMVGTFGAGTVFGSKAPPLAAARAILALKSTRLGQWLDNLIQSTAGDAATPETWGGIGMFTENLLRSDDPARLAVYENFRGNLEDILRAGKQAQVPILLSTVASNLRDCAPFASLHAESLTKEQLAEWETHYEQGKALEAKGALLEALQAYNLAAGIDPHFAELQFRIGRCHGFSRNWTEAKQAFAKARDHDGLVVRADSRINDIIREAAQRHGDSAVTLTDTVALLAHNSMGNVPGRDLFYEHVHYTASGNYHLARIFAEQVAMALPSPITATDQKEWVRAGTCQRQLALSLWDQNRIWMEMHERLSVPPFTAQATNSTDLAYFKANARKVSARMKTRIDRRIYELALAQDPDDYLLHAGFGKFLQETGSLTDAIRELQWICERFPNFEGGHQDLGIALFLADRFEEAADRFERVLEIRPGYTKAQQALDVLHSDPRFHSDRDEPKSP